MKETAEFWIKFDYAYRLFKPEEWKKDNGACVFVEIPITDPRFEKVFLVDKEMREQTLSFFLSTWHIRREYSPQEIAEAKLFQLGFRSYNICGEDCGTVYDESTACPICGANAKQVTPLHIYRNKIPKMDIAMTLASEVIVSDRFVRAVKERGLKGCAFSPVYSGKTPVETAFQLRAEKEIELSDKTIVGVDPFDFTEEEEADSFTICGYKLEYPKVVYKCPNGDNIGLNVISEAYVLDNPLIRQYDFLASRQRVGGRMGVFRPHPLYFVSPAFRQMIKEEKLLPPKLFNRLFEVAHIV